MISQREVNVLFLYNYVTGVISWRTKPSRSVSIGSKSGRPNSKGYLQTKINGKLILNHRIIFLWHHGYLPKYIDHIDGNPLNNKINNLRECSSTENNSNRRVSDNSKSGVKGLCWVKRNRKWRTKIVLNRESYYFGTFDDPEVAAQVLRIERLRLHGEFANNG